MRLFVSGAAGVLFVLGVVGCALVYDLDTNGYSVSGEGGAGFEDCGADAACPALALGCLSAQDCDGGMLCCLIIGGQSSAQSACSAGPCGGLFPIQLCKSPAECASGAGCVSQTCTLGTTSVGLEACGQLPQPLCAP